jgi:Dolichyl-phosphate-mannose-protein mannosyltransferase
MRYIANGTLQSGSPGIALRDGSDGGEVPLTTRVRDSDRTEILDVQASNSSISSVVRRQSDRSRVLKTILFSSFMVAAGIRLYNLAAPGVLVDRDFHSAILARHFFFQADNVESWRKDMASTLARKQSLLEPPVTEFLVSLVYRMAGREDMRFARVLTAAFWLLGGVLLYRLTQFVTTSDAAVFATIYYLFVPEGFQLSRSFQPDALMMLMFLGSLYAIWSYYQRPSAGTLAIAGSITGLTLLHRPLVLFALLAVFATLAVTQHGMKGLVRRHTLIFVFLALLPPTLYYGYGMFIADFLRKQSATSFRPYLLLHHEFWRGWFVLGVNEVGAAALVGALAGLGLLRRGLPLALMVGLGIGYLVFGLVFTMHIHTHGYYHAQLIPVVAISLGALLVEIATCLRTKCEQWYSWLPVVAALVLVSWFWQSQVRGGMRWQVFESESVAREIGERVGHSKHVVFLAPYYGLPLQYFGEFTGDYWPRGIPYWLYRQPGEQQRTIEERLRALEFTPDYFVITDFGEFREHHADLKEYLTRHLSLVAQSSQYLIYDSRKKQL